MRVCRLNVTQHITWSYNGCVTDVALLLLLVVFLQLPILPTSAAASSCWLRFVGLTRTAGAADKAHVKSICLREQNMLEAIRSLSDGGSSSSDVFRAKAGSKLEGDSSSTTSGRGDIDRDSSSSSSSISKAATAQTPSTSAASNRARRHAARAGTGGGGSTNRTNRSTPISPNSDATAETSFSETSSIATSASTVSGGGSGNVLDGAAAAATASLAGAPRTGVPGLCPPVNVPTSSGAAASPSQTVTRAQARAAQASPGAPSPTALAPSDPPPPGKELAPADEVSAPTAKGKDGGGGGVAPEAAAPAPDDNPWKVSLPVTLSPAARRYAATYLATCVRQALQRNPDQMAR